MASQKASTKIEGKKLDRAMVEYAQSQTARAGILDERAAQTLLRLSEMQATSAKVRRRTFKYIRKNFHVTDGASLTIKSARRELKILLDEQKSVQNAAAEVNALDVESAEINSEGEEELSPQEQPVSDHEVGPAMRVVPKTPHGLIVRKARSLVPYAVVIAIFVVGIGTSLLWWPSFSRWSGIPTPIRLNDTKQQEPKSAMQQRHSSQALEFNIYFSNGNARLSKQEKEKIHSFSGDLLENSNWRWDLIGYTSGSAGIAANEAVPRRRAEAVAAALVEQGVDRQLVNIKVVPLVSEPELEEKHSGPKQSSVKVKLRKR